MSQSSDSKQDSYAVAYSAVLPGMGLLLLCALALGRACTNQFVNFDDPLYVTNNDQVRRGVTLTGLRWAFTATEAANWHPLTWISLQLDYQLYGLKAWGFHLTNLLLHSASSLLLFRLFRGMTGAAGRSWLVAALFAVHPLHVESVAWIAERKDVLSTFFGIITMLAYARYAALPGILRYLAVVVGLSLSLLAKPMLVTLPFVLLLLDFWPLRRLSWGAFSAPGLSVSPRWLLLEKVPLLAPVAFSCVMTIIAQGRGQAFDPLEQLSWWPRLGNALVSYAQYLIQTVWPVNLAVFYPHPGQAVFWWRILAAACVLGGISLVSICQVRQRPYLLTGWLWYLGTLVPVIGLVQVGEQARADRYTYFPLIGIFLMLVWGLADIFQRWPQLRNLPRLLAGSALAACVALSWRQVGYWHDSERLWDHAVDVAADNYLARYNLGHALLNHGNYAGAEDNLIRSLQLKPNYWRALINLGLALQMQGKFDDAIVCYRQALALHPDLLTPRHNLGVALAQIGRTAEAIDQFRIAIACDPQWAEPYYSMASALEHEKRWQEALPYARECVRLRPGNSEYHLLLANVLAQAGQHDEAEAEYFRAQSLRQNARNR